MTESQHSGEDAATDRAALRMLAKHATSGPWAAKVLGSEGYEVRAAHPDERRRRDFRVARCGYEDWDSDRANAEYIAAFDPATVLALLDALDRVEALLTEDPVAKVYGPNAEFTVFKSEIQAALDGQGARSNRAATTGDES